MPYKSWLNCQMCTARACLIMLRMGALPHKMANYINSADTEPLCDCWMSLLSARIGVRPACFMAKGECFSWGVSRSLPSCCKSCAQALRTQGGMMGIQARISGFPFFPHKC